MRSSRPALVALVALSAAGLLLSSCAVAPRPAALDTQTLAASPCVLVGFDSAGAAAPAAQALRQRVETTPLFAAAIAPSAIASCRLDGSDGRLVASYLAGNGNMLRVERDERIEFSDQEAHFVAASREPPLALLQGAERAAFGAAGCGIDWARPEVRPSDAPASGATTVYRGDVCNCQARIERSSAGAVVMVGLRSAC